MFDNTTTASQSHHLSNSQKIGIATSLSLLGVLLIVLVLCFLIRKRHQNKKPVTSTYHTRFGSRDISSPMFGAYSSPNSSGHFGSSSVPLSKTRGLPTHPAYIPEGRKILLPERVLKVEPMVYKGGGDGAGSPESQRSVEQWPGSY